MTSVIALYMVGLAASAGGFTALVGYAMLWSARADDDDAAATEATGLTLDGSPVDMAIVLAVDPRRRWVDLAESELLAGGDRKLVTRWDPATNHEREVRHRRVGRVGFTRPTAHA